MCATKLITEVETRWNSTYQIFNRLIEQQSAVILTLSTLKYHFELLTDLEWNVLSITASTLVIFFILAKEVDRDKVNLSKVIAIKKQVIIPLYTSIEGIYLPCDNN